MGSEMCIRDRGEQDIQVFEKHKSQLLALSQSEAFFKLIVEQPSLEDSHLRTFIEWLGQHKPEVSEAIKKALKIGPINKKKRSFSDRKKENGNLSPSQYAIVKQRRALLDRELPGYIQARTPRKEGQGRQNAGPAPVLCSPVFKTSGN